MLIVCVQACILFVKVANYVRQIFPILHPFLIIVILALFEIIFS